MNPKINLTDCLTELLLKANWNCTTPERHITKVVVFARFGELESAIRKVLEKAEEERPYFKGMRSAADQLVQFGTAEIISTLDKLLNSLDLGREGIRFNVCNYNYLHRHGMLDLLPGFDTDFRGDISAHWTVPFTRGARTVFRTDQSKFYVSQLRDKSASALQDVESITFDTFDQAASFCLNPEFYRAISLLAEA